MTTALPSIPSRRRGPVSVKRITERIATRGWFAARDANGCLLCVRKTAKEARASAEHYLRTGRFDWEPMPALSRPARLEF